MKALLISPGPRPGVAALTEAAPLGLTKLLGKSLLEYWLAHLVQSGARRVQVLASDRPEQVRQELGDGSRWGLHLEVTPAARELSPAEARARYRSGCKPDWLPAPEDVSVADHLPGATHRPLGTGYADWFAGLVDWMPHAASPDRIGLRQLHPGIWCGRQTRVSPLAQLRPPCWLGESVWIGPGAVVGPEAVIEDRVFVDGRAEILRSVVGPETYVGQMAQIRDSLAWGNTLLNWQTGWRTEVSDAFLLAPLGSRRARSKPSGPWGRAAAVAVMGATLPLALVAMLKARLRGQPVFRRRLAVRPQLRDRRRQGLPVVYFELAAARGWLRRWPQLWKVACGEFAWVGNRPLDPEQALRLANDFERLWLTAPLGLVSLADANGCADVFDDEACAHASFYAACARPGLNRRILLRAVLGRLRPRRALPVAGEYTAPLAPLAEEQG
ncbi:MAG: sugar transferase [Verrucomicrobia bacterium]|nr:sugar transferase [Verrucomicrobiota bacterium]